MNCSLLNLLLREVIDYIIYMYIRLNKSIMLYCKSCAIESLGFPTCLLTISTRVLACVQIDIIYCSHYF